MKKTIIALLFIFSIVLIGCDDTSNLGDSPNMVEDVDHPDIEEDMGDMPDPGPDAEDNATDG